jgi:hypothetical protein
VNPDATAAPASVPPPVASPAESTSAPRDAGASVSNSSSAAVPEDTLALVAIEAGMQSAAGPMLGVRGLFELGPGIHLGTALHVALSSQTERLAGGGEVSGRGGAGRVFGAWGTELGPVLVYAGPGLSLRLTRGAGDGLDDDEAGLRVTWAAGLDAGVLWDAGGGWTLGAVGDLDVSIPKLGGRFYVGEEEVLEPETLQGWFGVAAGYGF